MDVVFNPVLGASGDMMLGALAEVQGGDALTELNEFLSALTKNSASVALEDVKRHGLSFRRARVTISGGTARRAAHWKDIRRLLEGAMPVHPCMEDAAAVFALLAEAEGKAHGVPPDEVHFHEVGALDSLADICGACFLMRRLRRERGEGRCFTLPLGCGEGVVRGAHGTMSNPAPATMAVLEAAGLPTMHHRTGQELVTPTAAALIAHFAEPMPEGYSGTVERAVRTTGTREWEDGFLSFFELRLMRPEGGPARETVVELSANVDDMTPEEIAGAVSYLLSRGALDAWAEPGWGKKGRACAVLKALCRARDAAAVEEAVFEATTTLGVRRSFSERTALPRETLEVDTPLGSVRVKVRRGGRLRWKAEADDVERIAEERGMPPLAVREAIAPHVEKAVRGKED